MRKKHLALLLLLSGLLCAACAAPAADMPAVEETAPPPELAETAPAETAVPTLLESYNSSDYTGLWHQSEVMPSGYANRYCFNADGTFVFANSEMDGASRELALAGFWKIDRDQLVLTIANKIVLEGGVAVPPYASYGSAYVLEGAVARFIRLDAADYESRTYKASTVCLSGPGFELKTFYPEEASLGELRRTVVIDGKQYWDISNWAYDDVFGYYESMSHGE